MLPRPLSNQGPIGPTLETPSATSFYQENVFADLLQQEEFRFSNILAAFYKGYFRANPVLVVEGNGLPHLGYENALEIVSFAVIVSKRWQAGRAFIILAARTWMTAGMGLCTATVAAATKSEADNKRDHLFSFALGTFISAACVTLNISGRSKHPQMKRELHY